MRLCVQVMRLLNGQVNMIMRSGVEVTNSRDESGTGVNWTLKIDEGDSGSKGNMTRY